MSPILVRQAVYADTEAIAPLFDAYRQFYGQVSELAASQAFIEARFEHGESVLFIAEEEGRPIGFAQLYPSFSSVSMARTFVLNDLFVSESERRKGVGNALLEAVAKYARKIG